MGFLLVMIIQVLNWQFRFKTVREKPKAIKGSAKSPQKRYIAQGIKLNPRYYL